jgi:hypothetical protein
MRHVPLKVMLSLDCPESGIDAPLSADRMDDWTSQITNSQHGVTIHLAWLKTNATSPPTTLEASNLLLQSQSLDLIVEIHDVPQRAFRNKEDMPGVLVRVDSRNEYLAIINQARDQNLSRRRTLQMSLVSPGTRWS